MAVELEQDVMRAIGLGNHYNWFNGSGSCGYIRRAAVDRLAAEAKKLDLDIAPKWIEHCQTATRVDGCDSEYTLTNTWIACSYAIQDAIYRKNGGKGFDPEPRWHFFTDQAQRTWEAQQVRQSIYRRGFGKMPAWGKFSEDD